ncbi:DUF2007 domain-containing protein [Alcanivorax sp. IO_7]|nr:DUF2007 domain-containing protein [Alcanivorax sp. IO_7]
MKRVYEARDGLEAHMVAGLMEQAGIMAQVRGDMLQGAVGELPAAGLASVWVADDDEARARAVVRDFEAEQPPNRNPGAPAPARERARRGRRRHRSGVPQWFARGRGAGRPGDGLVVDALTPIPKQAAIAAYLGASWRGPLSGTLFDRMSNREPQGRVHGVPGKGATPRRGPDGEPTLTSGWRACAPSR